MKVIKTDKVIIEEKIISNKVYVYKRFFDEIKMKNEIKMYKLLKGNNINIDVELEEVDSNTLIYSKVIGEKISSGIELSEEMYYKIGKELSKLHNIKYKESKENEPIFYQINIIEELKKISEKTRNEEILVIKKYILDNLDKISFRNMKFGLAIYDLNKEDIIIDRVGDIYFSNISKIEYNNQEMNYNIFYDNGFEKKENIKSFFKGYKENGNIDKETLERSKMFILIKELQKLENSDSEWDTGKIIELMKLNVEEIYKRMK